MKGMLCERCSRESNHGESFYLHRHHKIPRRRGGSDEDDNLLYLCPSCHAIEEWKLWHKERGQEHALQAHQIGARVLPGFESFFPAFPGGLAARKEADSET